MTERSMSVPDGLSGMRVDAGLARLIGLERQWLHARSLAFAHPADGRHIEITSPHPADLRHALDVLHGES
jgi:23S rRNA pseudouridine1911/1915/1917 synthase